MRVIFCLQDGWLAGRANLSLNEVSLLSYLCQTAIVVRGI